MFFGDRLLRRTLVLQKAVPRSVAQVYVGYLPGQVFASICAGIKTPEEYKSRRVLILQEYSSSKDGAWYGHYKWPGNFSIALF